MWKDWSAVLSMYWNVGTLTSIKWLWGHLLLIDVKKKHVMYNFVCDKLAEIPQHIASDFCQEIDTSQITDRLFEGVAWEIAWG